jgi:hypothetical protein
MRRTILTVLTVLAIQSVAGQNYDDYFEDKTLRLDYVFAGDSVNQEIYFNEAYSTPTWAGRRHNLSEPLLRGNGEIVLKEASTGKIIYSNSFSSLFQEWQSTEEATKVRKCFEMCMQVPFPKAPVEITVNLRDIHAKVSSTISHVIDPKDILIRPITSDNKYKYTLKSGDCKNCIDIAILAEGYSQADQEKFYADAQRATDAITGHEPFKSMKDKINIVAVGSVSSQSGVSVPHEGKWVNTNSRTHYDTFYSNRYLTTSDMRRIYDQLACVPFEHIIVLINTPNYGGGGIYNEVMFSSSDHATFRQVLVHEFGHSFGGLGDEYYYDDQYSSMYPSDTEPWEPNLTTLVDFDSKWKDMLPKGTKIPTEPDKRKKNTDVNKLTQKVGVYEGGGYQSKGVYRPVQECRMKINEVEHFCPVCSRAIKRMIEYYTE